MGQRKDTLAFNPAMSQGKDDGEGPDSNPPRADCHDGLKHGKRGSRMPSIKPSLRQRWGGIPAEHDVPIRPGPFIKNSRMGSVQRFSQFLIGDIRPHRFHILMGAIGHGIRQKSNRIG